MKTKDKKERTGFAAARIRAVLAVISCIALAPALTGCGLMPKEEELPKAPVMAEGQSQTYTLAQAVKGNVIVSDNVRVSYVPASSEKLSFSEGGEYVRHVYVKAGDKVKAGDVLMELDLTDINEQIQDQQDQLDQLTLSLGQLQESEEVDLEEARLKDAGNPNQTVSNETTVSEQYTTQESMLTNSIQVGQARLEELKAKRAKRQIIASIDGTVTYLYQYDQWEATEKDKQVAVISNMDMALFEAYSDNAAILTPGQTYTVTCGDKELQAVARTGKELNYSSLKPDSIYLQLTTPDPELSEGDKGTVSIVKEQSLDTLVVPSDAVEKQGDKTIVYVLNDKGYKEAQTVTCGLDNGTVVEIVDGLEEGQTIVMP